MCRPKEDGIAVSNVMGIGSESAPTSIVRLLRAAPSTIASGELEPLVTFRSACPLWPPLADTP
jgi:hypothetical protein